MKKLLTLRTLRIITIVVILFLVICLKKNICFFPHEKYSNTNKRYYTIDDFYFINDMDFIKNLSSSNKEIPKIIWTFWHDEKKIPNLVKYCIETWKESNPDYKIYLLTKNNYHNFINIPKYITDHPNMNDYYARFSDMIRIHLLYEYGGVWMDASIICKESLDDWFFKDIQSHGKNFFGYYIQQNITDNRFPVIENWFIASTPKNIFILLWKNEFMELTSFLSADEYLNNRKKLGVNFQKIPSPSYMAMYVSAQKILQIDKYPTDKMYLKKAEDGPYHYISINNWQSEKSLKMACNRKEYTKFMKLTNRERNFLQKYVDDYNSELSKYKCNWFENFVIL
jgi:hypothetical protein